jgi:murein L,D-transpeptidase YcbB/YkuD
MATWYVDKGLGTLIAQVRQRHPGIKIGTIGDQEHKARQSDHNPEADGSVDAADFMLGPDFTEADAEKLIAALVRNRDRRIAYIIHNRRIISSTVQPWKWRVYAGSSNPHTIEVHLSVNDLHESDASAWNLATAPSAPGYTGTPVRRGDDSGRVRQVQAALVRRGVHLTVDGHFGPATERAVKAFQAAHHLVPDGIVGPRTWKELFK